LHYDFRLHSTLTTSANFSEAGPLSSALIPQQINLQYVKLHRQKHGVSRRFHVRISQKGDSKDRISDPFFCGENAGLNVLSILQNVSLLHTSE
jgi:hypothetical protein